MYNQIKLSHTRSYDNAPPSKLSKLINVGKSGTTTAVVNYRSKIINGEDATSSRTATQTQADFGSYFFKTSVKSNPSDWESLSGNYYYIIPNNLDHYSHESRLRREALLSWYGNAGSKANIYIILGELRETVRMLKRPAVGIRKLVDKCTNANRKNRQRYRRLSDYRKAASDTWLEYSFGWKPLLSDISDIRKAIALTCANPSVFHAQGRSQDRFASYATYKDDGMLYPAHLETQTHVVQDVSCRVSGSYTISKDLSTGSYAFGSFPSSFMSAGWELMPWSFLIDYFSNIGDVLNARAIAKVVGINFLSSTYRSLARCTHTTYVNGLYNPAFRLEVSSPGHGKYEEKVIIRKVESGTIPPFEASASISGGQALNIAALISSMNADAVFRR